TFEQSHFDWSEIDMLQPEFSSSREAEDIQALSTYMLNVYQYGPDNIDSDDELPEDDESIPSSPGIDPSEEMRGDDAFDPYATGGQSKRARTNAENKEWFPWPDRTSCTLDILMHLPRSVFSTRQLDLFVFSAHDTLTCSRASTTSCEHGAWCKCLKLSQRCSTQSFLNNVNASSTSQCFLNDPMLPQRPNASSTTQCFLNDPMLPQRVNASSTIPCSSTAKRLLDRRTLLTPPWLFSTAPR
ncbi:hypothetical protein BDP27DRAFT_1376224, partial [Rhodocollybia butyracea]